MDLIGVLPHLQAVLNLTAMVSLISALQAIRRRDRATHKKRMGLALVVSTVFLVSYLVYHGAVGHLPFAGVGWIRPIYFTLLISHVMLALISVPLIFLALKRAPWQQSGPCEPCLPHRGIARWAAGVWLYVSISGLVVYGLAFHIYVDGK